MDNNEILKNLKSFIPKEQIKQNAQMKDYTAFKIGGPAEFLVKVTSIDEIKSVLSFCKNNEISLTIIGNGSNVLVLDKGIKGIVIKLDLKQIKIENIDEQNVEIIVDSGIKLGLLAQRLLKEKITGFEELSGIPGTIGGAIVMNAGAHGKEMKDIITEVTTIDYDGNIERFSNEEADFLYRHSKFSNGKYIILQAKMLLNKGNEQEIKNKMEEYLNYRKEKQPIEYPSAGSTFRRGEDYITAKLLDEAGLRGYSIGGAQISEKHAGFIINKGNATSKDVLDLVKYAQDKVFDKFGKKIELEIKILG